MAYDIKECVINSSIAQISLMFCNGKGKGIYLIVAEKRWKMPRPVKCRKVCSLPKKLQFNPEGDCEALSVVIMTVDEYEAVRLIDYQNFSQTECSEYMGIARSTVQQIYNSARGKIAKALVEGLPLKIHGGEYRLCDGKETYCGCGGCRKHAMQQEKKQD